MVEVPTSVGGAPAGGAGEPRPLTAPGAPASSGPTREVRGTASPGRGPAGVPMPRGGVSLPGSGPAEGPEVAVTSPPGSAPPGSVDAGAPDRRVGPGGDARGGDAPGVPAQAGTEIRGSGVPGGASEAPPVSDAARRILGVVERLQHAPPPRQVVVELPDLDGLRVLVEARGTSVHVVVLHGPTQGGQLDALARELAAGLSARGFDLAGFSGGRDRGPDPEPEPGPPWPRGQARGSHRAPREDVIRI